MLQLASLTLSQPGHDNWLALPLAVGGAKVQQEGPSKGGTTGKGPVGATEKDLSLH